MRKTVTAALAVLGVCWGVRQALDLPEGRERAYWQGRVRLRKIWNEGAAFSLPLPRRVLPAASGAALAFLWQQRRRAPAGVGLLLGGGLSNLLERTMNGRVCDYLQFPKAPGRLGRYIFNLADFAIFAGGALLLTGQRRARPEG